MVSTPSGISANPIKNATDVNATGMPIVPKMLHPDAYQKRDAGPGEAPGRSSECEGAGAASSGILFRQPESINGKVSAPDAQHEKAGQEPRQRAVLYIEYIAETSAIEAAINAK